MMNEVMRRLHLPTRPALQMMIKCINFPQVLSLRNRLALVPLRRVLGWFRWGLLRFVRVCFSSARTPAENSFSVLLHSDNYLVVNKHYDIVINGENHPISVQKQLCRHYPHLADSNLTHQFHFAHRLDYSTSGALCIALNKSAAASAMGAFSARRTEKYYLALVRGHVIEDKLLIDIGVGNDTRTLYSHRMCSSDKKFCKNSRMAVTALLVLQRGFYNEDPATKVLLKAVTGRRHQLRVHCMEIGHTIVGDFTYSDRNDILPFRMFLHAYRLVIPTKTEKVDVVTEDPFDETDLKNTWKPETTLHKLDDDVFRQFDNVEDYVCIER